MYLNQYLRRVNCSANLTVKEKKNPTSKVGFFKSKKAWQCPTFAWKKPHYHRR